MIVDTSINELKALSSSLEAFASKIRRDCQELSDSTDAVASTMAHEDVARIRSLSREISEILNAADPDLKKLKERVDAYITFVHRIKSIAGG